MVDNETGKIVSFQSFSTQEELTSACPSNPHCVLTKDQLFLPGFIDMHTHAPQYRNLGLGLDFPLLEWLEKVTFPEEIWYRRKEGEGEEEHRERIAAVYNPMVKHYLCNGTTTCCYFGSLDLESNKVLVEQVARHGQRALIGKTCMDCNSPPNYIETTATSVKDTKELVDHIKLTDARLSIPKRILPVVTPRFALTCSREAMKELSKIANAENVHIQTHMSENREEVAVASEMFSESQNYADIYRISGLLSKQTILAHCVHLTKEERAILSEYGAAVAHCPTSNFALNSGITDLRSLMTADIKVGLGSDVSGGYGLSILDAMRQAIIASKAIHFQDTSKSPLSVQEAIYLATLGGAKALALGDQIGSFEAGKFFDAILVDVSKCPAIRHPNESLMQSLHRFVFLGDDRWIIQVYVNGACIIAH